MRNLVYLAILSLILGCSTSKSESNIVLNFEGVENDSIYISSWPPLSRDDSQERYDTLILKNGKLEFKWEVSETHKVAIMPFSAALLDNGKKFTSNLNLINFYINPGDKMIIDAEVTPKTNSVIYSVSGNDISSDWASYRRSTHKIWYEAHKLSILRFFTTKDQLTDSLKEQMASTITKLRSEINESRRNYIENNRDSEFSAWLLFNEINTNDKKYVISQYNELSNQVKSSLWGSHLNKIVSAFNATSEGALFPNIVDTDIFGDSVNLYKIKKEFVLVDFWGTWCGPCQKEIPRLIEFYQKYNDKFEILSIACRDDKTRLTNFIKKEGLNWLNMLSSSEVDDRNYSEKFQIGTFPTKILLDKDKKVIKYSTGSDPQFFEDLEIYLNK